MRAVVFAYSNVGDRCLRVLVAGAVEVALVVTHRDHPGETLWFARVADTAAELGVPTVYAEDFDDAALLARVAQARPDAIFSFYYRRMLPAAVLALSPGRCFNLHGSLLPQFRGRAPTNWAVLKGATETGATLHEMVAKPDAGAIVDQCAVPILPDDTGRQVFDKVAVAAEVVLWRSLPAIVAGTQRRLPNDLVNGSYYGGRRPEDGRIDWTRSAPEVYNLIRAVAPPYPGAFCDIAGVRVVVAAARRAVTRHDAQRGEPTLAPGLHARAEGIIGVCGDGEALRILELTSADGPVDASRLEQLIYRHRTADSP